MYAVAQHFKAWLETQKCQSISSTIVNPNYEEFATSRLFIPANKNGASIFVVHGTGNDHLFGMTPLFMHLLSQGFSIFTFDVDGHGALSTSLLREKESLAGVQRALEHCIQLRHAHGLTGKLFGLGHSLGGSLLGTLALDLKTPFSAIVQHSVPKSLQLDLSVVVTEAVTGVSIDFWKVMGAFGFREGLPALGSFKRSIFPVRLPSGSSDYLPSIRYIINDLGQRLNPQRIPCPSLWVFGGLDRIARRSSWLPELSDTTLIQVKVFPFDNHYTMLMTQKSQVALAQFFQSFG